MLRAPSLAQLLVRVAPRTDTSGTGTLRPDRTVGLRRLRGRTDGFLLPDSTAVAARSLLVYNRLRPRRVRTIRALTATALRTGLAPLLTSAVPLEVAGQCDLLLEHLASMLQEPRLVLAGSDTPGTGFRTPVLQLFTPDGRPRGYAKVGWDPVTTAMIHTEADALEAAGRAGWSTVRVPRVAWVGHWYDLTILVTEPMPEPVRRLTRRELPPIDPLREVAELHGPVRASAVEQSGWWRDAQTVANAATRGGHDEIERALEQFACTFPDQVLRFGAWHGDWVEWNLARFDRQVMAWDWAYSAAGVPVGFDLLQFFHLRHHNLRGIPTDAALDLAARYAAPGLSALGLTPVEQDAVARLHRIEVALRIERARMARRTRAAVETGLAS